MLSSAAIKQRAAELGFDVCGISPARAFPELSFLSEWIARGYAGEMDYMEKSAAVRADIRNFLPSARSVVVFGTVYNTAESGQPMPKAGRATPFESRDMREATTITRSSRIGCSCSSSG